MANPVLLAVDGDQEALRSVDVELRDRYERQYRVECLGTAHEARALLRNLAESDEDVALVLAGLRLEGVRRP